MSFGCSYRKVVHNLSTDLFRFCYTSNVMHFFVCVPFPFKLLPKNKWHFLAASRFMMNVLFLFLLPENGIQINQLNWVFCLQRDVHLLNLHKDLISSAFKLFSRFLYIWHCAERQKRKRAHHLDEWSTLWIWLHPNHSPLHCSYWWWSLAF